MIEAAGNIVEYDYYWPEYEHGSIAETFAMYPIDMYISMASFR